MKRLSFYIFLAANACSAASPGDPPPAPAPPPAAPLQCDPASQDMGFYLWHYVEVSGNCGYIPDRIVVWPSAPMQPDAGVTCTSLSTEISDQNCKVSYEYACSFANGDRWRYARVLTQLTADGSQLSGELSEDGTGPGISGGGCSSLYSITLTRQ